MKLERLVAVLWIMFAVLIVTSALAGCHLAVPREIRHAQALVTDDQSITLDEVSDDLKRLGIPDGGPPGSRTTQPDLEALDRGQLLDAVLTYRRAFSCLARCERNNWIVRCWLTGGDPREAARAKELNKRE